ncbi:sensor histidine kinase [Aliiglaciecola litoralis]|uniref:Sensor histidine kinase n=1 Tax=Aliiglaciecola litoralis TaxID=582857 RepID=A0ABP3WT56_9ALTE
MDKLKQILSIEVATAILAWLVVSVSALSLMITAQRFPSADIVLAAACFVIFIISFVVAVSANDLRVNVQKRLALMALQYCVVLAAAWLLPYSFIAILITIWSAQLPYFVSMRAAILTSPFWSAPLWIIFAFHWQMSNVLLSALLFWTFNLFSLVMVNATIKEQRAREATNELNRKLIATQSLLSEASKQAERVRIARNIHDLLGHHLTALTINLQVASRITQGEAQQRVQQCHDLAKLLLSDVREAVSEIREKSTIDLVQALSALRDNVPNLHVTMQVQDDMNITDVDLAETILRCIQEAITNTLKHSKAKNFDIQLTQHDRWLSLEMRDDGQHSQPTELKKGNGLTGMLERIKEFDGVMETAISTTGFVTKISIPERSA